MKRRNIFSVLFILLLSLTVTACGGHSECEDRDGDGLCDVCCEPIEKEENDDVVLIKDGEATFQVVVAKELSSEIFSTAHSAIRGVLRNKHDISVSVITEGSEQDEIMPTEILIGEVASRHGVRSRRQGLRYQDGGLQDRHQLRFCRGTQGGNKGVFRQNSRGRHLGAYGHA